MCSSDLALVREGADDELARVFAGEVSAEALNRVLARNDDALLPWLDGPPQTNEPGRSGALINTSKSAPWQTTGSGSGPHDGPTAKKSTQHQRIEAARSLPRARPQNTNGEHLFGYSPSVRSGRCRSPR